MNRPAFVLALALAITTSAWLSHANAAPPTVVPSPGYDARLQEERAARSPASQPAGASAGTGPVVSRHHAKKAHHLTH